MGLFYCAVHASLYLHDTKSALSYPSRTAFDAMRYFIPAALALVLLPGAGLAQTTRCSNDGWGNITCRGSDGSNLRMSDDGWGNIRSTYRDGYGNSSRCTTTDDGWGNITTRCY